jgi:superfamily II RNA helicase
MTLGADLTVQFSLDYKKKEGEMPESGELLDLFLQHVENQNLSLYPAQEEAILSLYDGNNVLLCTPTGSGKSMVAKALHFWSFARGRRSYYTCPIKALVNEKFLDLCRSFGPENVGMVTGDATVNADAPIVCCTAEILANIVLRDGESADVHDIIMDEFHYYSDRERGVAWQLPLLVSKYSRFLLMSATMGDPEPFQEQLKILTGLPTDIVKSEERPVPLEFIYSESPLTQTLVNLVETGHAPVYLVSFTQREAAEFAQGLLSVELSSKDEKKLIAAELLGFKFSSPYGKEIKKLLRHGVGVHHAGLLPKYRLLVERLAQKGLLKVICGTDTLGVGVNVPIRTVHFTKLCKYDGEKTGVLKVRDFHQIAGRAGRKGFDDQGTVVVQAPEHAIENLSLSAKAGGDPKKLRKIKKKQPPQRGYAHWDQLTFDKLRDSAPEKLKSSFQVSHGMILNVLSRPNDGCNAVRQLIRDCHETDNTKAKLRRQGFKLFRSLVERDIVEFVTDGSGKKIRVNVELQDDFSIFQELAIWLLDTLPKLDPETEEYALDKLTMIEAICENPRVILLKQLDKLKGQKIGELKSEGVDYDERMAIIEDMTYPKPHEEFIYAEFNGFQRQHPWLDDSNIKPKSIARDMFEQYMSFDEYIKEYGLQRSEGILLRYLSEVYKVMTQTVPDYLHEEDFEEIVLFLKLVVGQVDNSLLEEWEKIKNPEAVQTQKEAVEVDLSDITRNKKGFSIIIRNTVFKLLRMLAQEKFGPLCDSLEPSTSKTWREPDISAAIKPYYEQHQYISTDKDSRAPRYHTLTKTDDNFWRVEQILTDADEHNDWMMVLQIDLNKSRESQDCVISLESIEEIGN